MGWPDPALDPKFQVKLDKGCPLGGDGNVSGNLDATPEVFDNQYFKDLSEFFKAFVDGMIKMGDLDSGQPWEIRRNCCGQEPARGDVVGGLKGREGEGKGKGNLRD
ncbi:peroxidase superfamily protein [Actinidia rufa]|uniref:Peroxidase superfamily protein n=1 Tax=Actinidia rufa TaxID=165716 RepID=A0A7J0EML9_9ERIC|nr:peroxidase superfamily protein [Actinidia rufa]